MTGGNQNADGNPQEQVTVTDKRRIDPETGEVRHAPPGTTPGPTVGKADEAGAKVAELTADLGPATVQGANFNIKATPASNGIGCEDDPCLTLAEFDNTLRVRKEGKGALLLGSSVHDPLADIKVVQLRNASYIEGDLISRCRTIARGHADLAFSYAELGLARDAPVFVLNPLVGLVDGLRWSLVGGAAPPLADIASLVSTVVIVVGGLYYFRSVEDGFADVI